MNLEKLSLIINTRKLMENKGDDLFSLIDGVYQKETITALNRTISQVKPILEQELNRTLTNDEAQFIVKEFIGY
jgi:hypothetical protein